MNGVKAADSTIRAWAGKGPAGDSTAAAHLVDYWLIQLAVVEGRLRDVERLSKRAWDPSNRDAVVGGTSDGIAGNEIGVTKMLALANVEVRRDPERARRSLEAVEFRQRWDSTSPLERRYEWWVHVLARGGHTAEARALVAEYDATVPPSLRGLADAELTMGWARGELALAENHPDDAVRYFLDFHRKSGYCAACILPELGRAYEAAGQPDSAAAVYERYLGVKGDLERLFWDGAYLVAVLERLAQLRERRGDARGAAECYRRIIVLWARADPELQPRVRYARERLLALSDERRARLTWRGLPTARVRRRPAATTEGRDRVPLECPHQAESGGERQPRFLDHEFVRLEREPSRQRRSGSL
jgi:tetratricopeptide (TPR) repeat protein